MGMLLEHWGSGARWLGCNAIGLVGLWGSGCLLFFLTDPPWGELIDRGQFFVYSMGVLAQVIFILTKELKITTLPMRSPFLIFSIIWMLLCVFLYSGTFLSYIVDSPAIVARLWLLRPLGMSLFAISKLVGLLVTIIAENRQDVDLEEINRRNVSSLDDRVSKNLGQTS